MVPANCDRSSEHDMICQRVLLSHPALPAVASALLVLFSPAGQLERVVTPPCINLAPTGAPSNKPSVIHKPSNSAAAAAGGSGSSKARQKAGSSKGGRGPGSKGGVGMKSCESFVVSPDEHKPLVAFLGDNGHVGLVSLGSRTSVGSLKMNGSARAAAFSSDGSTLVTAGETHMQKMLYEKQPCVQWWAPFHWPLHQHSA